MKLNWNLHPFEIWRRLSCVFADCLSDFEIRHPETRRRIAIELKLRLGENDKVQFQRLLKRFETAKLVISIFDWPILIEWNEWKKQALCLAAVNERLSEAPPLREQAFAIKLRKKFSDIQEEIRTHALPDDPSIWSCLRFRWKFAPLRQEAAYYAQRWDSIRAHESGAKAS